MDAGAGRRGSWHGQGCGRGRGGRQDARPALRRCRLPRDSARERALRGRLGFWPRIPPMELRGFFVLPPTVEIRGAPAAFVAANGCGRRCKQHARGSNRPSNRRRGRRRGRRGRRICSWGLAIPPDDGTDRRLLAGDASESDTVGYGVALFGARESYGEGVERVC
jgi:hypothetical protein